MREQILALIAQGKSLGEIAAETGLTAQQVVDCYNGKRMDTDAVRRFDKSDYRARLRLCVMIHNAQPPERLPIRVRSFCKHPCHWSRGRDACVMPGGCWREIFKK